MGRRPVPLDPDNGPVEMFAAELRALRDSRDVPTVDAIAARSDIPRSTLYAVLAGKRVPGERVLITLAEAYGADADHWLTKRSRLLDELASQAETPTEHSFTQSLDRERLGKLVRAARNARGLSQAQLGELMGGSQAKINRIEFAKVATTVSDIEKIIEVLEPSPGTAEEMVRLARATPHGKHWSGKRGKTPKRSRTLFEVEQEAKIIRALHSERMPGLLQSDMYMWCQAGLKIELDRMPEAIRSRTERKKIFDLATGPEIAYILSESSIRRTVRGSTAAAIDQIRELLRLDERYPRLSIRILPFDADINFIPTDFTILEFADPKNDHVYIEYATKFARLNNPTDRVMYNQLWEKLDAAALSRADSRIFLQRVKKEFDDGSSE